MPVPCGLLFHAFQYLQCKGVNSAHLTWLQNSHRTTHITRPIRIEYEGAIYHVTARGNERREIFRSDDDGRLFLATLEQCVKGSRRGSGDIYQQNEGCFEMPFGQSAQEATVQS